MRAGSFRTADLRLKHRHLRLFRDHYIHVFQLWFQLRLSYCSLFSFDLCEWTNFLLCNSLLLSWYRLSSFNLT